MSKSKAIFALLSCTVCKYPSRVTRRNAKKALPEISRFCRRCRKHTAHKSKDVRKPVKK